MHFSEILCLATYDWFCADGSHLFCVTSSNSLYILLIKVMARKFSDLFVPFTCGKGTIVLINIFTGL